ncbi:MAG: imidazole glycerol phosphate synthase cyclase subunit, partial [Thermoguttaceae bacterium]|nr:imidazole glycerol phosphate synthase cyclase subunit [Thermoguttaceae bacterium]
TVGGGIRTVEDFRKILNAGADKVSINSSAVKTPDLINAAAERFGSQCVVVNIDPKRVVKDGKEFWEVFINGGRIGTGLEAVAWAREVEERGAGEIVLTSMDGDGTRNGYDIPILKAVCDAVRIPVVASGGAGKPQHFVDAIVQANASAVLAASVFHYGIHSIAEVKEAMRAAGVPVRI